MLEKGFHDFDRISKTYPLQSLKIKNVLRMERVQKTGYTGFPVQKLHI
jgi:hypothetical protein